MVFLGIFIVTASVFAVLWGCQVVLLGHFYGQVKIEELKRATNTVGAMLSAGDSEVAIDSFTASDEVNIRVISLANFEDIYSGGDGIASATHDIGDFELLNLYRLASENGGEVSQYYRYDKQKEYSMFFRLPEQENGSTPDDSAQPNDNHPASPPGKHDHGIGVRFFRGTPPQFVGSSARYVDDFLYVKLIGTDDAEYMIIADIQVTPLDSTVRILKSMLAFTTFIALIVSVIVSYFVSRAIARPIENINSEALGMAHGNFDTAFSGKGYREIEQLSDTLTYTAHELGRVNEFRKEMLSNVSHDLRTPLTMIGGYAEMMRDIPGENTPENAQIIIDEAKRLTDFVNNILDLSKLESGIDEMHTDVLDLSVLLEGIRERYTGLVGKSGYTICFEPKEGAFIRADEEKITRAFLNLMDNAVNHTGDDKTVRIALSVDDNTVRAEIRDTGDGIPKEDLPYIWDRYYRGSKAHKRAVIGSGIGLSIVKAIFEQHHLRYGVESADGSGTTFYVEFARTEAPTDNE